MDTGEPTEMIFIVRQTVGGWMVEDGSSVGPLTREQAMDLAEGMAAAIRRTGGRARVVVARSQV